MINDFFSALELEYIFTNILFILCTLIIGFFYNSIYKANYKNKIIKHLVKYILPLLLFSIFILPIIPFITLAAFDIISSNGFQNEGLFILFSSYFIGISYIIGSIPFGLLISKLFTKKDVRKFGSGNIGSTNVLRIAGKKAAILTLILDFSKSYIPFTILRESFEYNEMIATVGIYIILGHIFPIWLNFKGGKGVAVALGIYWSADVNLGLFASCIWLLTFRFFRYSSLSSLTMVITAPIFMACIHDNVYTITLLIAIAFIIICCHSKNIIRLFKGNEHKISL